MTDNQIPDDNLMTLDLAISTQRRYLCAACWGPLVVLAVKDSRLMQVTCPGCGDGHGFTSARTVEIKVAQDFSKYLEASQNLRKYFATRPAQSADQILKDLGF